MVEFLFSFCLALLTEAKLLSLASISSLRALDTVSLNSLLFVPDFKFFLSLISLSPFSLLVALCSANFLRSKLFVVRGDLGANDVFTEAPLLNVVLIFGLNPPALEYPPLLEICLAVFQLLQSFFPRVFASSIF